MSGSPNLSFTNVWALLPQLYLAHAQESQWLIVPPSTIVLRPSGRYCAELKPTLATYLYQPVTNTAIVGSMEGVDVGITLGINDVGLAVGMKLGLEGYVDGVTVGRGVGLAVMR